MAERSRTRALVASHRQEDSNVNKRSRKMTNNNTNKGLPFAPPGSLSGTACNRPLIGSQQSNASSSSSSSSSSAATMSACRPEATAGPFTEQQAASYISTPCKLMVGLTLQGSEGVVSPDSCRKTKRKKSQAGLKSKSKLLSSKSLSHLVPGAFFAKKRSKAQGQGVVAPLPTTRSFPSGAFHFEFEPTSSETCTNFQEASPPELPPRQVKSLSLIGMPGLSTTSIEQSINGQGSNSGSVSQSEMLRNVLASTPSLRVRTPRSCVNTEGVAGAPSSGGRDCEAERQPIKSKAPGKYQYRPFRNTALVLKDVKNSIGFRMKARQESKAFARLAEEAATPPTKLYEPFDIYTPGCAIENEQLAFGRQLSAGRQQLGKAAKDTKPGGGRRLAMLRRANQRSEQQRSQQNALPDDVMTDNSMTSDSGFDGSRSLAEESMTSCSNGNSNNNNIVTNPSRVLSRKSLLSFVGARSNHSASNNNNNGTTPKGRIALMHKRHLMQTNKFAFDSPTGRLRETVKDVEQFQQCIEDISTAIRARGQRAGS